MGLRPQLTRHTRGPWRAFVCSWLPSAFSLPQPAKQPAKQGFGLGTGGAVIPDLTSAAFGRQTPPPRDCSAEDGSAPADNGKDNVACDGELIPADEHYSPRREPGPDTQTTKQLP